LQTNGKQNPRNGNGVVIRLKDETGSGKAGGVETWILLCRSFPLRKGERKYVLTISASEGRE
jgi:hypothetical protein